MRGTLFLVVGRGPLGRLGLIWLASLAWFKSARRLAMRWLRQPTWRLKLVINSWLTAPCRLVISREILPTHSSTNIGSRSSIDLVQYRTPSKKQESWSKLDFLFEKSRVLNQLQYNDYRFYHFTVNLSALTSYCSFSQYVALAELRS